MTSYIPITLIGNTLGERHHHLNNLVAEAYQQRLPFSSVQDLQECSSIDRLFKINLASKMNNVDYIIHNLKEEDMLYVSTALKSYWLLEEQYQHFINPLYLEEKMYPEMITTAVNKMKHWIHLNLRNPTRCAEFYDYYSSHSDINLAIKFLSHCSKDFVLSKVTNILEKLTPQHLKILIEQYPEVSKLYFEALQNNDDVVSRYLENEKQYYNNMRLLLKRDADIFLDITEKYFNKYNFKTFSPEATKYVMNNCKKRYNQKPELYAAWLLDIETLGSCLNENEIKDLVLKLARAKYLSSWFNYKTVEPLIKKLSTEERTTFKKQVFVDKSYGEMVENWPYDLPSAPEKKKNEADIFKDDAYNVNPCDMMEACSFREVGMERKYRRCNMVPVKTHLDKLFDQYRFSSFEKTLAELTRKMSVETMQNRQDMMLVLVSKSGGRPESVEILLNLLMERHENEPANLRAAIIRSMVKRCSAWRLPQHIWEILLKFGRDLGLNAAPPTAPCIEGLHAVVLRNILLDQDCEPAVKKEFLNQFSTLREYTLTAKERKVVSVKLPEMLLSEAKDNPSQAYMRLQQLLNTLNAYNIGADRHPGVITAISATVDCDPNAKILLYQLFDARVGRKELFSQNFSVIQNDASYFNALKHDALILKTGTQFETLIQENKIKHERFLKSLALYFGEQNGIAEKYLSILEKYANVSPNNKIARSLTRLAGERIKQILQNIDASSQDKTYKRFAAALRANMHLARPLIDLDSLGWRFVGAKAVATRVLICSNLKVETCIEKLLSWSRTARIALALSMRVNKESAILTIVAEKRPKLVLKSALWYNRRGRLDTKIWDVVIPLIGKLNISLKLYERLRNALTANITKVPENRRADYCVAVFNAFRKIETKSSLISILFQLEDMLASLDDKIIENIIDDFLVHELTEENFTKEDLRYQHYFVQYVRVFIRIIAKYLLLCKTESEQSYRIENIAQPLFKRMKNFRKISDKNKNFEFHEVFISALQYNTVFIDPVYASCIPIFEYVIKQLEDFIPMETNFNIYVRLHLSMLYFKSIRNCIKNTPGMFVERGNRSHAIEVVGNTFGKYVASEISELQAKYFESVIDLYKQELMTYMRNYFTYGSARTALLVSVIKGIMSSEHSKSHLLAEYLYNEERYSIPDTAKQDIKKMLKEGSQEVQFLYYSRCFG